MPRTFDMSDDSPASVEQVHSAFRDADYWQARVATFGAEGTSTLDSLIVDEDGTVVVATTLGLLRDRLPGFVSQLGTGDLHMLHKERWSWIGGGRVRGEVTVAVPGTAVSALSAACLAPVHSGSHMTYSTTVQVKVPFVGGRIESFMVGRLAEGIAEIQQFTAAWIAGNRRPAGGTDRSTAL